MLKLPNTVSYDVNTRTKGISELFVTLHLTGTTEGYMCMCICRSPGSTIGAFLNSLLCTMFKNAMTCKSNFLLFVTYMRKHAVAYAKSS